MSLKFTERATGRRLPALVLVGLVCVGSGLGSFAGKDEAYRLYRKAESRIERRQYDEALDLIERAIAQHPESGVIQMGIQSRQYFPYYLRGIVHLRLGDSEAALGDFAHERELGRIQDVGTAYARLLSAIDEAEARDTERPEVSIESTEFIEFEFVERNGREVEQIEFRVTGHALDARSGIRTISIAGREAALTAGDGRYDFDERIRIDATATGIPIVVRDAAGNEMRTEYPIEIPALDLGERATEIHAVIVGVNEYDKTLRGADGDCTDEVRTSCDAGDDFACYHLADLSYSVNDARHLSNLLIRRGVPRENVTLLVTGDGQRDATRENVLDALRKLKSAEGKKAIFYFSGHGMLSAHEENLLLLSDSRTWECRSNGDEQPSEFERSTLSVAEVASELKNSHSPERFIILDACRSPLIATKSAGKTANSPGFSAAAVKGLRLVLEQLPESNGSDPIIFYSTLEEKVSVEWNTKASGYFTWFLLQGLRQDLPLDRLKRFVQSEVRRQTSEDLCSPDLPMEACAYLQLPYLQLPKDLEQDYERQSRTFILGGN